MPEERPGRVRLGWCGPHGRAGDMHHAGRDPRSCRNTAHVEGRYLLRLGRLQEVQRAGHDYAYGLAQVDDPPDIGMRQHRGWIGQIGGGGGDPGLAGEQGPQMGNHDGIEVDVGDPRVRVHRPGRFIERRPGRQPGPEVDELGDTGLGRPGHRLDSECPVVAHHRRDSRVDLAHLLRELPVGGEIVFPAQPVVIDPGDIRAGRVKPLHGRHASRSRAGRPGKRGTRTDQARRQAGAAAPAAGYQPTATTMYCGFVTEMSEDCPA